MADASDETLLPLRRRMFEPQAANAVTPPAAAAAATERDEDENQTERMERELRPLLDRMGNILPYVLLFLLKFVSEHALDIALVTAYSVVIYKLDKRFREELIQKNYQSYPTMLLLAILSVSMLAVMYVTINAIDDTSPAIWRRLLFLTDITEKINFLQVIWRTITADLIVQTAFLSLKMLTAIAGQCRTRGIPYPRNISDCRHLCPSTIARLIARYVRIPTTEVDIEAGLRGHEHESDNVANVVRTYSSEHMQKKRLLSLIDAVGSMYRTALPAPLWVQYYSAGVTPSGLFVPFYFLLKMRSTVDAMSSLSYAVTSYVTNHLEHGRYATREELSSSRTEHTDCTICYDPFNNPVILPCGHIFCEECIGEWLDRERSCPVCRAQVPSDAPNSFNVSRSFHLHML